MIKDAFLILIKPANIKVGEFLRLHTCWSSRTFTICNKLDLLKKNVSVVLSTLYQVFLKEQDIHLCCSNEHILLKLQLL